MLHRTLLKMGLLPPLVNILLVLLGLWLLRKHRRLGYACCLLGLVSLYLFSTPYVASGLSQWVEPGQKLQAGQLQGLDQVAIVVLGAGHVEHRREYGQPWPDDNAIERLNYAADLHRRTQLPLLLSGGQPEHSEHRHADVMAAYLSRMHFIRPTWLEGESRTTEENAKLSAELLSTQGVEAVVLVTQAYHMRRAQLLFERAGLGVIPAPTGFVESPSPGLGAWLVSATSLKQSRELLHEVLGLAWYSLQD